VSSTTFQRVSSQKGDWFCQDRSMTGGPPSTEPVATLLRTELSDRRRVRVGLISDTHIPEARAELWPQVFTAFDSVDVILHGGDIHDVVVLDQLAALAPVYSARGNGEDGSAGRPIAPDHHRLRYSWLLDLASVRVGLTHDLPIPEYPPRLTVERWKQRRFATSDIDVLVYGDSHVEGIEVVGSTLCVNPGSPTYPHNLNTQLGTLGYLDIDDGVVRASLWQLTDDTPVLMAESEHAMPLVAAPAVPEETR
jgi:putative phosphoesterase